MLDSRAKQEYKRKLLELRRIGCRPVTSVSPTLWTYPANGVTWATANADRRETPFVISGSSVRIRRVAPGTISFSLDGRNVTKDGEISRS